MILRYGLSLFCALLLCGFESALAAESKKVELKKPTVAVKPSAKAVPSKKTVKSILRYKDGSYRTYYTDGSYSYTTSNPKVIEEVNQQVKGLNKTFKEIY